MMFALFVLLTAIHLTGAVDVQVDSCTISGNGHIHTLDGARYDLHGTGVLSAISNDFLDYQIHLHAMNPDNTNNSYARRSAVSIKGNGKCHDSACPERHTIIIRYGVDVTANDTVPDFVHVSFQHANDSSENFYAQFTMSELPGSLDDKTVSALNQTGVDMHKVGDNALTIVIGMDMQAPVVITIGPAFTAISTEALGGALSGANGLCGLYSRSAVDDFNGAVVGGKADFYSNDKITEWARQFVRSPQLFPNSQSDYDTTGELVTVPNRVEFWTSDSLIASLQECPGAISNVTFRLCVRDYTIPNGKPIGCSNYAVVLAAQVDAAYIASQSPTATTPNVVERRESAKTSTTVATAVTSALGAACMIGIIANRRLRQRHSKELTIARANAIRLADNF